MDGDNYIRIYSFMRKMGLSGVKRDVYALIYGFTKNSKKHGLMAQLIISLNGQVADVLF